MPFLPSGSLADGGDIVAAAAEAVRLARQGDARSGLVLAQTARRRARDLEAHAGELEALNAAAIVHLLRRDVVSAVAAALDACDLGRRRNERSLLGHARVTLALAAFELEASADPTEELRSCAMEARWIGDNALQARARAALGVVLGDLGAFDEAAMELSRALLLARSCECATSPPRLTANIANLHRKRAWAHFAAGEREAGLRETLSAREVARRAAALALEQGETSAQIDALGIAGAAAALAGDPEEALAAFSESIDVARRVRCRGTIAWVLLERARLALAAGDITAARRDYLEAHDLAMEVRPSRKVAAACRGLQEAAALAGDQDAARYWGERAAGEASEFDRLREQTRMQLEAFAANA